VTTETDAARLRATALRLLAQREHSRSELQRKLLQSARRAVRRAQAAANAPDRSSGAGLARLAGHPDGGQATHRAGPQAGAPTGRQTGRQAGLQVGRQVDAQADHQVGRQVCCEAVHPAPDDDHCAQALSAQIEAVLDALTQRGLLSDERVAQQWLASRAPRHGERRLRQDLAAKGLASELVQQTLAEARLTELPRALAVWRRRFAAPPADAAEHARQLRFLAARGFTMATIGALMKQLRQDGDTLRTAAWEDDPPAGPD
jgi:regulatory protein